MSIKRPTLFDGRLLAKSAGWNFAGAVASFPAAIFAIPILIEGMGTTRFGVLTLAWMVVGYFSFFDLGLGRALTKLVAERIGSDQYTEIPHVFWTAIKLMTGLGLVGAAFIAGIAPKLAGSALGTSPELLDETIIACLLLSASIPLVIVTGGFRGVLEAHQQFAAATALRVPIGILTYLAPIAILPYSNSLPWTIGTLVVVRTASCIAHAAVCWHMHPTLRCIQPWDGRFASLLLRFGGWLTISSIIGPLLLYLGRAVIATKLSADAVAYFVVPYEVVTQLLIVPTVAVGVLFPAFSQLILSDPSMLRALYKKSLALVGVVIFPLAAIVIALANEGLTIWINAEFATNGVRVVQILAIGVFVNSFGLISQALIQAHGRPDWTAKLHMVELMLYIPYLFKLTQSYGIEGAAVAWTLRVGLSTLALFYLANKAMGLTMPHSR